jgi:flavin reductase (DIM6/NTAB) family NADH-FMN oxidoreductase RutF
LAVSESSFRNALARFASGVTVVTGVSPTNGLVGVTATAFSSVSLDPPLVSVCLGKETACLGAFTEGAHFTVNILSSGQKSLSETFARRSKDKFAGVDYQLGENGCPRFSGCLAVLECSREGIYEAGDHWVFLGRVDKVGAVNSGEPLIYFCGAYRDIGGTPQS